MCPTPTLCDTNTSPQTTCRGLSLCISQNPRWDHLASLSLIGC